MKLLAIAMTGNWTDEERASRLAPHTQLLPQIKASEPQAL